MSFKPPYKHRFMALINDEPVELHRFQRPIYHSDEKFWSAGLSGPWWWERPMMERECITPRVKVRDLSAPGGLRQRLSLRPKEIKALELQGLQPEYKL